jgi:hypothetical protein
MRMLGGAGALTSGVAWTLASLQARPLRAGDATGRDDASGGARSDVNAVTSKDLRSG